MGVFSVFSLFTLFVSHVIVINNQVNIVSSSEDDGSRLLGQFAQAMFLGAARRAQQQAREQARSQNNNQEFVNKVIGAIKEALDEKADHFVGHCKSKGMCLKKNIKDKIANGLISTSQEKFGYLDQTYMDQIVNATNR